MTEQMASVSVVLPYYDRADTLGRAVASVLAQTHHNLTLYLVDDGSNDTSWEVARSFKDDRIVHIRLESNGGVSAARNEGIAAASGAQLLAFMDSDDEWLPSKLQDQISFLNECQKSDRRVSVVGCGWRLAGSSQIHDFSEGPFDVFDLLCNRTRGLGTPMLLVDRNRAARGVTFDPEMPALVDRDFVMSCLSNGSVAAVLSSVHVIVHRGRHDHVASPYRAGLAYQRIRHKYADLIDPYPNLVSWYSFRAAREFMVCGRIRSGLREVRSALKFHRSLRVTHLLLAAVARRRGAALAQRLCPISRSEVA